MHLLVTRPEPDAERTAATLRARGHEVLIAPLLRIAAVAADFGAGPWSAVAVTSANAVDALRQHERLGELLALPVFAVGRRSAAAARALGFGEVASADGNERDLVRTIVARAGGGAPVLYLAGEDRAGDLAGDLAAHGIAVRTVVVYRAAKATAFAPALREALAQGRLGGVLHYSRRSAEAYLDCARAAGILDGALAPVHYCLSRQVAEPLIEAGAGRIAVAARPEEAALLDLVAKS